MANNVAGQLLVYALLLFFMLVVVFLSYALILHTEQSQMWNTIKDRGASRVLPNGTTNYWYYIVRVSYERSTGVKWYNRDLISAMEKALHEFLCPPLGSILLVLLDFSHCKEKYDTLATRSKCKTVLMH
uniref:Uncharacterized protein n=1 Tax=Anopheles farauti TaxID=69004 RepID=A0A182QM16_9DIPT